MHVLGQDAELLGRHGGEHHVRPLPDLGRAARDRHAAAAIERDDRSRVRHVVPVDGEARAGDVRAPGEAHAAAARLGSVVEARRLRHALDALAQAHGRDPELVHGLAVRRLEVDAAQLGRIEGEVRGDLVHLAFQGEVADVSRFPSQG